MAQTPVQPTRTWIPRLAAHALVMERCSLSFAAAEKLLARWLDDGRVGWEHVRINDPRPVRPGSQLGGYDIYVVTEDVELQLARYAEPASAPSPAPVAPFPAPVASSASPAPPPPLSATKQWIYEFLRHHSDASAREVWENRPDGAPDVKLKTVQNLVSECRKLPELS